MVSPTVQWNAGTLVSSRLFLPYVVLHSFPQAWLSTLGLAFLSQSTQQITVLLFKDIRPNSLTLHLHEWRLQRHLKSWAKLLDFWPDLVTFKQLVLNKPRFSMTFWGISPKDNLRHHIISPKRCLSICKSKYMKIWICFPAKIVQFLKYQKCICWVSFLW